MLCLMTATNSMRLLRGSTLLATISDLQPDMPFFEGRFIAEPAFEQVRPLFEDEWRILNERPFEEWEQAWNLVRALGLSLDPGDGSPSRGPEEYLLHVKGDRARLRY